MLKKATVRLAAIAFILSSVSLTSPCLAQWTPGDDIVPIPPTISQWEQYGSMRTFWLIDGDGVLWKFPVRALTATKNLASSHCMTSRDSVLIAHHHWEGDFTPAIIPSVDAYWDERFSWPGTFRMSSATNRQNCHAWALDVCTSGTYNYWMDWPAVATAYGKDTSLKIGYPSNGDIILYEGEHASVYATFYSLVWKWQYSGVYIYYWLDWPPPSGACPFNIPGVVGENENGKHVTSQPWTYTWDVMPPWIDRDIRTPN